MTHPNTDRDERVSRAPERIFIIPTRWGTLTVTEKPTEQGRQYFEYVRTDTAATRMRDLCIEAIKSLRAVPRGAAYNNAINDAIHKVESLTLEQGGGRRVRNEGATY